MNPSVIQQAQDQSQQNFGNDFGGNGIANMASQGSTIDQAKQELANTQPTQTQAPAQKGNLFTRLLPTGAGIVGGLVSGALDLGTGGLASALDPAIVGAFTAAGKAGENALEGKKVLQGNDLTAGAEGAAGQFGGNLLGKGLSTVGGKLSQAGADRASALSSAAEGANADQAALDEANAIRNNYGGVKPGVQSANDLADNLDLLKKFGVDHTDPNAMQAASKGGLFINDIDNAALASGNPVKTTDLLSSKDIMNSTPEEQQALANAGIITPEGGLPQSVTPVQANQFAQDLNGQIRDLKATMDNAQANGRINDYNAAKQQFNELNKMYTNVQNLAATPEVNASIASRTISPDEKEQLVNQFGQNEADHIEQQVNNAKTHQDLVTAKLPFAQMNTISKQALEDMQASGTGRALARNKADIATAPVTQSTPNKLIDLAGGAEALLGHNPLVGGGMVLANHLAQSPAALQGAGNILKGVGGSALPGIAGTVVGSSPNTVSGPASDSNAVQLPQMNQGNSILDQALYQALENPLNGGLSQVGNLLPLVQREHQAQAAEQSLANDFNQAGGGQGPLGGILGRLGATLTGGEAASYPAQAAADAQAIASATGIPASQVESELPKTTQNQGAAQASLGNINSLIQSLLLQQGNGSKGLLNAVY